MEASCSDEYADCAAAATAIVVGSRGNGGRAAAYTAARRYHSLMHNQLGERRNVSQQVNANADQRRKGQAVEKYVTQNIAFMPVPLGCRGGDDNALRVDHL